MFRDFPRANLGPVIGPCFSPIETEIPKFYNKFPVLMSEFVLYFGDNFMKIAPKLMKLQACGSFDEYF